MTKLRRQHIGFVFQFFNLLPMLTAEENILLPLSIAGRSPTRREFEELLKHGRARRPAQAPSVGALRRPAAARRDRARARLQADRGLRRRADRQPRLEDGRRDPRADARLGRPYGQTTVMVTHDAARRGDRRPGALPRRRPDRPRPRPERAQTRSSRRSAQLASRVIRVALRGCSGRKLRAALTAIAIVLGVAMVSGTFVLTDSIDKAFDSIFTRRPPGLGRRHHAASRRSTSPTTAGTTAPPFAESLLAKVRALPGVADAERRASTARRS